MAVKRRVAPAHYLSYARGPQMDHDAVVRQQMTDKYLLNELDPLVRDEFEEHYFDCRLCALEVHAGALFIESSKVVLAERPEAPPLRLPASDPAPNIPRWLAWFSPRVALPVFAMLLVVVGYQNLVTYPQLERQLNSPQVLAWAPVNLDTYGSERPTITSQPGRAFLLLVRLPPGSPYSRYTADLFNPAGKLEWSFAFTVPASSRQDQWPLEVPGANRQAGRYELKLRGITPSGENKDVGETSFELEIQK
jgi:hypothetical protein